MHDPFYFRLFYPFLFPYVQSNLVQCTFTVLAFLITKLLSVYSSSQKSIIYTKGALSIVCMGNFEENCCIILVTVMDGVLNIFGGVSFITFGLDPGVHLCILICGCCIYYILSQPPFYLFLSHYFPLSISFPVLVTRH